MRLTFLATACVLISAGCSKGKDAGSDKTNAKAIEYDLGPAGPDWAGWTAQAPPGCKVMKDFTGARIGCDGPDIAESARTGRNGFDIKFVHGITDIADLKKRRKDRWAKKSAAGEHTILTDAPGFLSWREGRGKIVAFHFVMVLKVGPKNVTCTTNMLRGAGTEAEHQAHLAACRTLRHKDIQAAATIESSDKAPHKIPTSSCDERKDKGVCTDAFPEAWTLGEKHVRSNCTRGVFAKTPCPTAQLLGFCGVGDAYRISYYAGARQGFDAKTAAAACNDQYAGEFTPPKPAK